jgi:hypothetical protein
MPIAWAAAIGAVGSVVSSGMQASGQQAAANTQQGMFNTIVGQEQPFLQGGYGAETTLQQMTQPGGYLTQQFNPTQQQLEDYPGYQFQKQQGELALDSANSAGGSALSGPAMKSLMSFDQGLAASNYSNYFNQFQTQQNNIFNRLQGIASMGQNAAGNLGTAGANLGTGIAQAQAGAAGSIAGGIAGASNNIGQGLMMSSLMGNSGGSNNNPSNWDTENTSNFQDFASSGGS